MHAHIQAWLDQEDAKVTETIRRHGWMIMYVHDCQDRAAPTFAYTVGLFGLKHPELLIFDVDQDTAAMVLNRIGDRVRHGTNLLPGRMIRVAGWPHRIVPEEVPNPGEIVFEANRFYDRPAQASVPVLQLTYDDGKGRFPGDAGYSSPHTQPRPGTFRA
jgi:hypothetical protein